MPSYPEMIEEFRLLFSLAYDERRNCLYNFRDDGEEEVVVKFAPDGVKVQLHRLRQFLALKNMCLIIRFDNIRLSQVPVDNIPENLRSIKKKVRDIHYEFTMDSFTWEKDYKSRAWLVGKKVIRPYSRNQFKVDDLSPISEKRYVKFIVGLAKSGKEIEYTCDPLICDRNSKSNTGKPGFLKPIFFNKEVLTKYIQKPQRYRVQDGLLTCIGFWNLKIDNDLPNTVVVMLGYLGSMPYKDQQHWRSYNIQPTGRISRTASERWIWGEFADPTQPDLRFNAAYEKFQTAWNHKFGWDIFLPLQKGDEHIVQMLHLPFTDTQPEFDTQIGYLAKLLVDSINKHIIRKEIDDTDSNVDSIELLATWLTRRNIRLDPDLMGVLRDIKSLRSTGVAHRKGNNYNRVVARMGIEHRGRIAVLTELFQRATELLNTLEDRFIDLPGPL
jgi:hypothetical protein